MKKRIIAVTLIISVVIFASIFIIKYIGTKYFSSSKRVPVIETSQATALSKDKAQTRFEMALHQVLQTLEIKEDDIHVSTDKEKSQQNIRVRIAQGRPIEWIVWDICRSVSTVSYRVTDCVYDERTKSCRLTFNTDREQPSTVNLELKPSDHFLSTTARLAILIEDFEFQADQTTIGILSFNEPLTISLNPLSKKSQWTAEAANQYNKEVVIRVALEPLIKVSLPASLPMILVHYSADSIRSIVATAAKSLPNFSGFNNVLGARALENQRVMDVFLNEIKRHHGYFIETQEARNSTAAVTSKSIGLPYAAITSYIPKNASRTEIESNLRHFCVVAQKRGKMLVSATASPALVEAMQVMPQIFKQNGIRLVYVSEIVDIPERK